MGKVEQFKAFPNGSINKNEFYMKTKFNFAYKTFLTLVFTLSVNIVWASTTQESVEADSKAQRTYEHIIELLPEDFKPAFTRETVIKLNAIVRRSYDVINEFDALNKQQKVSAGDNVSSNFISTDSLKTLNIRSQSALIDMNKAVKTLKSSGEYYNESVLEGMLTFVTDVNDELSAASKRVPKS